MCEREHILFPVDGSPKDSLLCVAYSYEVRRKNKSSLEDIANFIEEKYPDESGIIYCFSRNECERITEKLRVPSPPQICLLEDKTIISLSFSHSTTT